MAAKCELWIRAFLSGLGIEVDFNKKFDLGETPTGHCHQYRTQATADSDEVLDLGDIATVDMIILKAVTNDLDVDTSYASSFSKELSMTEGETQVFKPEGITRIKNGTAAEVCVYEYVIIGRT